MSTSSGLEVLEGVFIEPRKDLYFELSETSPLDTSLSLGERTIKKFVNFSGFTSSAIKDYNARIQQMFKLVNMTEIPFNANTRIIFNNTRYSLPKIRDNKGNERDMYPRDARLNEDSYYFEIHTEIKEIDEEGNVIVNEEGKPHQENLFLLKMPIMIKSDYDNLQGFAEAQIFRKGEEFNDPGGYFIISGREYLIVLFENLRLDKFILAQNYSSEKKYLKSSVSMTSDDIGGTRKAQVYSKDNTSSSNNNIIYLDIPFLKQQAQSGEVAFEIFEVYRFYDDIHFANDEDIISEILKYVPKEHKIAARAQLEHNRLHNAKNKRNPRQEIVKEIAKIKNHTIVEDKLSELVNDTAKLNSFKNDGIKLLDNEKHVLDKIKHEGFKENLIRLLELDFTELYEKINARTDYVVYGGDDETNNEEVIENLKIAFFGQLYQANKIYFEGTDKATSGRVPEIYTFDEAFKKYFDEFMVNFFPKAPNVQAKLAMISLLTSRLLLLRAGVLKPSDKNSWSNIKYKTPGEVLFRTFATIFKNIKSEIERRILEKKRSYKLANEDKTVNFEEIFSKALSTSPDKIISNFRKSEWNMSKNSDKKNTFSQILKRDNYVDMITHLMMGTTAAGEQGKNIEAKQLDNTEIMYICPAHTPEGGRCGQVKHLAKTARYTHERDNTDTIVQILRGVMKNVQIEPDTTHATQLIYNDVERGYVNKDIFLKTLEFSLQADFKFKTKGNKLFVTSDYEYSKISSLIQSNWSEVFSTPFLFNGIFLGYVQGAYEKKVLKHAKRTGVIPQDACVIYDPRENICYLYTSPGRLVRPIFVIDEHGEIVYDKMNFDDDATIQDIMNAGAIELLDVYEQEYAYIARDREDLKMKQREIEELEKEINLIKSTGSTYLVQKDEKKYYVSDEQLEELKDKFEQEKTAKLQKISKQIENTVKYAVSSYAEIIKINLLTESPELSFEEKIAKLNITQTYDEYLTILFEQGQNNFEENLKRAAKALAVENADNIDLLEAAAMRVNREVEDLSETLAQKEKDLIEIENEIENTLEEIKQFQGNKAGMYYQLELFRAKASEIKIEIKSGKATFMSLDDNFTGHVMSVYEKITNEYNKSVDEYRLVLTDQKADLKSYYFDYEQAKSHQLNYTQLTDKKQEGILISLHQRLLIIRSKTKYDYLEIDPNAMFGVAASAGMFNHMNMGPRNVYQASHAGSSIGIHHGNEALRFDDSKSLISPGSPIISSAFAEFSHQAESGAGYPVTIIYANLTGFGVEDAIILNKSSVDRGLLHVQKKKIYKDDLTQVSNNINEYFGVPPDGAAGKRNDERVYRFIDPVTKRLRERTEIFEKHASKFAVSQLAQKRVYLQRGDCIIAKYRAITDSTGAKRYQDVSTYLRDEEEGWVEKVYYTQQTTKVKIITTAIPQAGDKYTTVHAQKGVAGIVLPGTDMPFSERTGQTPDVIVNSLGIPSRMTIGQIMEFIVSKAAAMKFQRGTATAFKKYNIDDVHETLISNGFNANGYENYIDGATGEMIPAQVYSGLVYLRPLKHMVSDKIQARSFGAVERNRQPVRGKDHGGGLRISTNIRSALIAHGAMSVLRDRMGTSSDSVMLDLCKCGFTMETHTGDKVCPVCKDGGRYEGYAAVPFVTKRIQAYSLASGFKIKIKLKKREDYFNMMKLAGVKMYEE